MTCGICILYLRNTKEGFNTKALYSALFINIITMKEKHNVGDTTHGFKHLPMSCIHIQDI